MKFLRITVWSGIFSLAALLLAEAAQAQLRCENRVISRGDSQARVFALCGEPIWTEYRRREIARHVAWWEVERVTTRDEIWSYDFGPHRLTHQLTFRNGRLYRLEAGHRGVFRISGSRASWFRVNDWDFVDPRRESDRSIDTPALSGRSSTRDESRLRLGAYE